MDIQDISDFILGNVRHSEITQVGKLVTVIQTTVQVIQQIVLTKVYIVRPIS
jgi:hypothetical protein